MNHRRELLLALGAAAAMPRSAIAQSKRPALIGWLHFGSRESGARFFSAFREGLAVLGWGSDSRLLIEQRWADGRIERLAEIAKEVAARNPAVIVAAPSQAVAAAAKAAPTTPIVQANGGDPVLSGFAASLARPGGTITGVSNVTADVTEKFVELLLGAAPKLRRVGFLIDSTTIARTAIVDAVRRSAARYGIEAHIAEAARVEEIEAGLAQLAKDRAQGLVVASSGLFAFERRRIIKFAQQYRWPTVGGGREWPEDGALLSYFVDAAENYRRAAYYVDRILKGAKPGDLPIEQPTKFELVVNMKIAKALGLTIPQSILVRADRVIE